MSSAVSVLYFVILQILWMFRSVYEALLSGNKSKNDAPSKQETEKTSESLDNKRRHLIHLFTTTPNESNRRPICYMHVCEIITPDEEEMLRCACAKGSPNNRRYFSNDRKFPPTSRVSRATFTNAWMESFSLVI